MIVLYRMDGALRRSEVGDRTNISLRPGINGSWMLEVADPVSGYGIYAINGLNVAIQCPDKESGEAAIRKMCENVRFVDLTKFQEE